MLPPSHSNGSHLARLQVTAYYAPQFAELRRRCVAGGDSAFLASISRCRKWASRGGKSAVYFARTLDRRWVGRAEQSRGGQGGAPGCMFVGWAVRGSLSTWLVAHPK